MTIMPAVNNLSTLMVNLPPKPAHVYPIWIGPHQLTQVTRWMPKGVSQVVIITDETVKELYGSSLENALLTAGYQPILLTVPAGEHAKTRDQKAALEDLLLAKACDRQTVIIALGGGVVGDLTGFVAATYLRGIRFIQIPTTLLAMVDSAVGGKTAIDTPFGKNMIGAFWQPIAVVADVACLHTLSQDQRINGLLEAVKMFLTDDAASVAWLTDHLDDLLAGDSAFQTALIHRAVTIKAQTVSADEHEKGRRMVLNFGHTIGHALEQLTDYAWLHGYAVGVGMLVEAAIARQLNVLSQADYDTVKALLARLGIAGSALQDFDVEDVIRATHHDKKCQGGEVHYVLLAGIGRVLTRHDAFTQAVSPEIVKAAFLAVKGDVHAGK